MPQSVSCDLLLYADDSCLVFTDKNVDNIEDKLNEKFNSIYDWFVDHGVLEKWSGYLYLKMDKNIIRYYSIILYFTP